ncbi:MAG: hypothetical protein H0T69_03480 [Thermoleophilaceae bacterium]|nr:hypothetical protein [Thermoleophilaceae bacterium]
MVQTKGRGVSFQVSIQALMSARAPLTPWRPRRRHGLLAGLRHLGAQGGLALGVVLDRRVVAHGCDQRGDLGPEALLEVATLDVGVLEPSWELFKSAHGLNVPTPIGALVKRR